jgi:hypothetical protein
MTVLLSPVGGVAAQFFDNNGNPLSGGKLFSYAAGTTTPAATYTSSLGTTAHTNPIILDSGGRVPGGEIWLTDGVIYKFVLETSTNVLIATYDNIVGINSNFVNFTAEQEIQTATAGQTVFNLTTMQYQPGTNSLTVYVDGVNQYGPGAQYAYLETDSDTVTFVSGLHVGASVKFTTATQTTGNATDASVVTYTPAGTGAVTRSVQTKLRETLISRNDYATAGNFNTAAAASPTIPSLDGSGNFNAKVTPAGENSQLNLNAAVLTVAAGPRDAVIYAGAQSVRVFRNFATMGGFRFRGQYTKGRAPTFAMPSNKVASLTTDLGAMSATTFENWYAVFACADDGDATATLKIMPFLRAGVVSGSNIPLSRAGEGIYITSTQTYAWTSTNNLAGTDLLVISENGGFSGRVTTITANSTSQITAATIGSITEGDYLLPAPPGFDNYVYLGSFYEDTAEVRNIYDTGNLVKAKMIYLVFPNVPTGSLPGPPGQTFDCAGYICPLATGIVIDSSCVLSTASTGNYVEYFDGDGGNHILQSCVVYKDNGTNMSVCFDNVQVPFLYYQTFNFYNDGSLTATRINGQLNVTGWFEP